ncbi:MAG TPA: galactose oxidase-like domain-containing protein [Gemmatimonadales bacterium]|nr:galactose oxidase-like domain-containing protein [Gemmatimonadales bacterium]
MFPALPAVLLALAACGREAAPPAPPSGDVPPQVAEGDDAPIRALYLCGNRFILINAHPYPVRVTWRVQGTDEQGEQTLVAAPNGDPAFSEVELSVRQAGALALYRDDELLAVRENERTACEPSIGAVSPAVAATSDTGAWSAPAPWPIVAVHLHLLRNGKVLAWGKFGDPYVYNPATGAFTAEPAGAWLFCAGHSFLPDGRLLVAGGHISDDHGLPDTHIFNPADQTWQTAAPMRRGRWYPTTTTLPNGQVVVIAGRDESGSNVPVPEVWTGSSWRALTGASRNFAYYPRAFVAPNGKIFYAGHEKISRWLSTSGSGVWTTGPSHLSGDRDYGAAVMYLPGKILYVGGGRTLATAETIDLTNASPAWKATGRMAYPRRHLNATVLPTGEVLVTGGTRGTSFNEPSLAVHVAEIWNPATGAWRQVASNAVDRAYHSTSLLLPDGRVLHAGSGNGMAADGSPLPDQKNAELYSPPYLFKGTRPTLSSAPSSVAYGQTFTAGTPDPAGVRKVSLIALGSTTHAFDANQRFSWLTFTATSGGVSVRAPSDRNLAPPGYYMLFILNASDVPSKARIIRLR